ncbi:MAG: GGDEF domain-containing protein, partial [Acholeplasma sp.]|nr:GGDEF domain-containing protein [Acholeplasma sp.]
SEFKEEAYLLMLDIDHFKLINDQYGHIVGDKVLKEVARLMKRVFDNTDVIARYGGDEFLILAKTSLYDMVKRTEKLRSVIETNPITFEQHVIYVTVSIGVTKIGGPNIMENIAKSDDLLYQSKTLGRNRVTF